MMLFRCIIPLIIGITMVFTSCAKRHVQIDRETRRAIDTLASHEIRLLRPEIDSLCIWKMDSLVASMRDSVMTARREEMRKLLGK